MLPINSHSSQPNFNPQTKKAAKFAAFLGFVIVPLREMGAEGLETNGQNAGETVESEIGGTPGGTLRRDDRLHAVIDAWITLSERDRVAILKIVQTTSGQPPTG